MVQVFGAGLLVDAVANSENAVVQVFGAALLVPVDTFAVELERLVAGIDCYAAGTLGGNGSLEGILVARLNINEADVPGPLVPWVVPALVILPLVWVSLLSVDAPVVLDVLEGGVHESTLAAHVAVFPAAVNKVLLRKAGENTSCAVVHRLQGSCGGEAPARSALTLVLHRGDRSVLPPVDVLGERGDVS